MDVIYLTWINIKIEHKKIFRDPSKFLKYISWPINICLKYYDPHKNPPVPPPTYLMYGPLALVFCPCQSTCILLNYFGIFNFIYSRVNILTDCRHLR